VGVSNGRSFFYTSTAPSPLRKLNETANSTIAGRAGEGFYAQKTPL
jgi:hypothetical protein